MRESYILFIKGFIIGLGKIIPGVSGALLAISMGIYDEALNAIGNFFKDIKKNIKFLIPTGIGVLLAIIFFSNVIAFLLNQYCFVTMLLFIGLIVGGVPSLLKNFNNNKFKIKDFYFILIIIIFLVLLFMLIKGNYVILGKITQTKIYWLLLGSVDALTMLIPGISGTAVFVMLGCFDDIINLYANPFSNISSIIPFGLGIILTILLITKFVSYLFKKYTKSMYLIVIVLLLISLISLIISVVNNPFNKLEIALGLILFIIGIIITYKLEK